MLMPQETTVVQVVNADLAMKSTLCLSMQMQTILDIPLKLVHLFVKTIELTLAKNVTIAMYIAQVPVNVKKDGRSILLLISLMSLKQIPHAAPYVEMVIQMLERNATHQMLVLSFVQNHVIVCRDINEILILIGQLLSQFLTSHAPNFVETVIMINLKSARLGMLIARCLVNVRWAMR